MKEIEDFDIKRKRWASLKRDLDDLSVFLEKKDLMDEDESALFLLQFSTCEKVLKGFETELLFLGKFDKKSAVLTLHAGAGGDDAQDWTGMLFRMYLRFSEKMGWNVVILDESRGSEAGYKKISFEVQGKRAFAYLKAEAGVHRLVRLSPFNSDNLRQTSFSLLEIVPLLKKEDFDSFDINLKDLRIDTFRSSGAGGQSVNTTDSAVRVTHIPTGMVASCQNERSQLQNKEKAMEVLRSKLLQEMEKNKAKELKELKGCHQSNEWGSQIRSYVLHPYKMVKDHRSNFESSNVEAVLEGDLLDFVEAFLRI